MSPEQARGDDAGAGSDVFSLGVMLFEMATGRLPFQAAGTIELLSAVLKDRAPLLSDVKPDMPEGLGRIIECCLRKPAEDRYASASELHRALTVLRQGESVPVTIETSRAKKATSELPWIAVLPFRTRTDDADLEGLADGLSEDVAAGLSRFSYLMVVSHSSSGAISKGRADPRQAGERLGARYVITGNLRGGGSRIRIGTQAIDTRTGTHVWAESFDRDLDGVDLFDLQDEIVDRVVATIADPFGVLVRSMSAEIIDKPIDALTPYEAILRYFRYQYRVDPEEHGRITALLERIVKLQPNNANVWAALSQTQIEERIHGFNPRPDPLDRALASAQRAVKADPSNQIAWQTLAQVQYHRQDLSAFRTTAERAIALNRRGSGALAICGVFFGYSGDWERGVALTRRAMQLNPDHPGWYWFTLFFHAYHLRDYDAALDAAGKIGMPEYWGDPLARTIVNAQLGNTEATERARAELLRLFPTFEADYQRVGIEPWLYAQPDFADHVFEGLAKAGLAMQR